MALKSTILDNALKLPIEDRSDIAEQLFASVEGEVGTDELWTEEIARRIVDIDAGKAELLSWEQARNRIEE